MEEGSEKKSYEIAFLSRSEEGAQEVLGVLKRAGAEVLFEGPVTRIPIAYKIGKDHSGHFGYFHFSLAPEGVRHIEDQLRNREGVLRSLIITPPFGKMRARQSVPPKRRQSAVSAPSVEYKQPTPITNEALEQQLKEILQ